VPPPSSRIEAQTPSPTVCDIQTAERIVAIGDLAKLKGAREIQANGLALALFGRAALAEDAEVEDRPSGFSGVALAHNVRSEDEVDRVYAAAVAVGAQAVKLPRKAHWGGYSGYFADPDWHLWEVAFNPFFPLDEAGNLRLPG